MPGIDETENQWRYRVKDPNLFSRVRPKDITKGVSILGGPLKEGGGYTTQSYRFNKTRFKTRESVRAWLKKEGIIKFIDLGITKRVDLGIDMSLMLVYEGLKGSDGTNDNAAFETGSNKGIAFFTEVAKEDWDLGDVTIKKGEELRYVMGPVLVPEEVDLTRTERSEGDVVSEEEIRKAAHQFMLDYRGQGHDVMHSRQELPSVKPVETFLAPVDFTLGKMAVKKGTWLMGSLVLADKYWTDVKSGKITGYSIEGAANVSFQDF